jgi:GT2 family glycosyltransferase
MNMVSVIVPTLNEAGTIGSLLKALNGQIVDVPFEVIVVDGGSIDGTFDIVAHYPSVRFIQTVAGVSLQRNAGAAAASGDLLVFLDADTSPSRYFLKNVANAYRTRSFAVACPWFFPSTWRPDIQVIYAIFNVMFFMSQLRFHTGAGVCIVTPKDMFTRVGGFDSALHLGEDVRYLQMASEHGRHRHLLTPLYTSPRRFENEGVLKTLLFYIRISPALLSQHQEKLTTVKYLPVRKDEIY